MTRNEAIEYVRSRPMPDVETTIAAMNERFFGTGAARSLPHLVAARNAAGVTGTIDESPAKIYQRRVMMPHDNRPNRNKATGPLPKPIAACEKAVVHAGRPKRWGRDGKSSIPDRVYCLRCGRTAIYRDAAVSEHWRVEIPGETR